MSFKNIGKVFEAGSNRDDIISVLKDTGKLETAWNALKYNKSFSKETMAHLLKDAFPDKDEDSIKTLIKDFDSFGKISEKLKVKLKDLKTATVGVFKSISTFIISNPLIIAAAAAVAAAVAAAALVSAAVTDAQEKAEKAVSSSEKYKETKSEVDSIESQLETIGNQIDELNAKENLSFTEQSELVNLQAQSAELQRQLELKQALLKAEKEQAARDAKEAMDAHSAELTVDDSQGGLWTSIKKAYGKIRDKLGFSESAQDILLGTPGAPFLQDSVAKTIDENILDRINTAKEEMQELKNLQKSQTVDNYDDVQKQIDNQQKVVDNYRENIQGLYSELESYASSFYDEETGDVLSGFASEAKRWEEVQKEYLSFLSNNEGQNIDKSIEGVLSKVKFDGIKDKLVEVAKKGSSTLNTTLDEADYSDLISSLGEGLDISEDVAKEKLKTYIMSIASPEALNIEEVKRQLLNKFIEDEPGLGRNLRTAGENAWREFTRGMSDDDFEILYSIQKDSDTSTWEIEDWEAAFRKVKKAALDTEYSIDTITEKVTNLKTAISSINEKVNGQGTGFSVSTDIFDDNTLDDYASALEYVNGSYRLNREEVKKITEAKVKEQLATNNLAKTQKQQEYIKNAREILELTNKLEDNSLAADESTESIQAQIDTLTTANDAIVNQCAQYDLLNASLRESIGIYQEWKDAQNASESGDMFDDSKTAWKQIRDTSDKDSDDYGKVGNQKYQASVDFLVPENIDHSDQTAVQKYLDSIKKYMYFDSDGNVNGVNMDTFFSNAVKNGLMIDNGDSYELAGQMSMQSFADGMGMSLPLVQAIFGEVLEYMPEGDLWFSWTDEAVESLGDLSVAASDAVGNLSSSSAFEDLDINLDLSDLDDDKKKIESLKSTIEQMNTVKASPDIDTSQVNDANTIIQYCVQQMQQLEEPSVMSVDTSMVEGQLGNALTSLQNFQNAVNELEVLTAIGADTTDAEEKVKSAIASVQAINPKILAQLGIDPTSESTISQSISDLTLETLVKLGVDEDAIIGYTAEEKDGLVIYKPDHSAVDAYNPPDLHREVKYTPKQVGTLPAGSIIPSVSGSQGKNGKGSLNGTAHANGTWGAKIGGTTLVGELGREIVVDPSTGKWHTVGDNGAEFANIPKGAIVFNHLQTEELLNNGFVTSRASALASGNALMSGNAMLTGGIPKSSTKNKNNNQQTTENKSSSTKSSTKSNTKSTDANTKATEDNTEAQENLQDWISRLTDNMKDWNDTFKDAIDQFEMNYNQNRAIDEYVANSESYKQNLRNAANTYMSKANSLGLSGGYIHKIWNGTMEIEDIQDENLREKIEKYTEWYDKARSLNAEIAEINQSIKETKIKKLENIKDDYDNLVNLSTSISDYNESVSDLAEKLNGVGDANALLSSMNAQLAIRQALVNSEAQLNAQLNALVADGTIGLYTDTWNQWKEEINSVKKSIIEADEALNELKQSIIEIRFDSFTKSIDNLDFKSDISSSIQDLLSDEGIYDDNVRITSEGYTKLGLMGADLVDAKQKVANYNEAIRALNENYVQGNISQADFNEKLQEYQKEQMDAVSATKKARDAIIDLIKEGIEKETEAMDELISKRKEDLDKQKEYYDFQKKMTDQTKEMNKLRAQLASLEGDDSIEATAKRRKLESQLRDLQEAYDENQKDHERDVVSEAYDKTLEDFTENQDKTLKELETSLDKQNKAIADALEATKNNYGDVYSVLTELSNQYNFTLTDSLVNPWLSAENAVKQYQDAVNKLDPNISIDSSKINTSAPSSSATVPTKNESKYVTTKNQNGTWLNQNGRWWYQHNDGGWTNNGWENIDGSWYKFDKQGWMQTGWQPWGTDSTGNTAWYYLNTSGAMAKSTWIAGKNGEQYYVDSSGVMARNGYVRSADGSKYYWVNANGVWEPKWTTANPNLSKYKLYYSSGTPKGKNQLGFMDDIDGKLQLGSEALITEKGVLGNWGNNVIFSQEQTQRLFEMSNGNFAGLDGMLKNVKTSLPMDITNTTNQGDINIHYDNLINVEGDVNKEMFPGIEVMLKKGLDYNMKQLKKYAGRLK